MKRFAVIALLIFTSAFAFAAGPVSENKIKVLVLTGGHGFKAEPFFRMFTDNSEITVTTASHAETATTPATAYERDDLLKFDVVVLYDSVRFSTQEQRDHFLSLFEKGIGVIVLHHAYLSFPDWPDYARIAGGQYVYLEEQRQRGLASSHYTKVMVEILVTIANNAHPATAGLHDFGLRDELYTDMHMVGEVTPLLQTSGELLAWAREEKKSRIVGTILGHGPLAHENPNFRKFLAQSIRWVARR